MLTHRLPNETVLSIIDAVQAVVPRDALAAVFLFGSRADVHARGGDLDLWVLCEHEENVEPGWARLIRRRL